MEYVIYCRKSTDESSDNQKQSIPDQIKTCIEYAKREGLKIKEKPKNFSMFESELEIHKEDNDSDLSNRKIYQETRGLYIIKEQETAKIPGKRKKWKQLIKLVKAGKINGIISYSPDRQSRNMIEGGEIIDLVDQNKLKENREKGITILSLKYTNFHFEDNAAGKMMLGIWFVFSKQYSDKLGEDILRGTNSKVEQGRAIGRYKPGYFINEEGYHEPHPQNFGLIQEAFYKKIDGEPESLIKEFLDSNGFIREFKKSGDRKPIAKSLLNRMFRDEFYYGMFINGDTVSDLRETNKYYKPVITEEQFQILQERYYKNPLVISKSKTKDIYDDIKVFDTDFILTEDQFGLTFSVPNKKRYETKIEEENKLGKKLSIKDVIKPNQIHYRCANKSSKYYGYTTTHEEIDEAILKKLESFKVGEQEFKKYIEFINTKLATITLSTKEKVASKNLEIGRLKSKKEEYIKKNMSKITDDEERRIYNETKEDYDTKIRFLRKEIEGLDEGERNEIIELEVFMDVLSNAKNYYKKASYVQKRKITKILFLNIVLDHEKRLQIQVKPELETLFNPIWWS